MRLILLASSLIQMARIVKPTLGSILHWIADVLADQIISVLLMNAAELALCWARC